MKIFMSNLSTKTSQEELLKIFEHFGPVESIQIIRDTITNESKGICFIKMEENDAWNAIEALQELELEGRKILVKKARTKIRMNRPTEMNA